MCFIGIDFIPFLLVVICLYYIIPRQYRYMLLLVASYFFYGFNDYRFTIILALVTVFTYIGGILIEKYHMHSCFLFFFFLNLGILFMFKYADFTIEHLSYAVSLMHMDPSSLKKINLAVPVGMSFYVFQSTAYLNDIYRKGLKAEKNLLRYAVFVAFFPFVLSGPIQKARDILPQLKRPNDFSSEVFIRGFILFVWGYFEKIVVSDQLKIVVDKCWDGKGNANGLYAVVAAVAFSIYIYCDFSSYSDMACGIARMLCFNVKNNFNNPYLATSLSQFWNCWHMTLNDWFLENVYIPLGGNRNGKLKKYINVMAVFLFSGAWHGAAIHYIIWGGLNGLLQIIGQILKPFKHRVYEYCRVDEQCFSIRFIKRVGVFIIITITWIFFRANDTGSAIQMIRNLLNVSLSDYFNPVILSVCGSTVETLFCVLATIVFLFVQYRRKDGSKYILAFRSQPLLFQTLILGVAICVIIMTRTYGTSSINNEFIYFQF